MTGESVIGRAGSEHFGRDCMGFIVISHVTAVGKLVQALHLQEGPQAGKMTQQVKGLAARPDN